jgi:hypothetical protein
MKRKNKSTLIYPDYNGANVETYINNPLEPMFKDMDDEQFITDLKEFYKVKKTATLFDRIKSGILCHPFFFQKLCAVTKLSPKDFITQFVELFSSQIDDQLTTKLHDMYLNEH